MKVYTEVTWELNDSDELVETSSKSEEYNGEVALCSNAQFNPFAGNWGWLGTQKSSKLGTVRRAQEAGNLEDKVTPTGQIFSGQSKSAGLVPTFKEFERLYSKPWQKIGVEDPLKELQGEWAYDPQLKGTALENVMMPDTIGTALTGLETRFQNQETTYKETLEQAKIDKADALSMEREAGRQYSRDLGKIQRTQGEQLRGQFQEGDRVAAAGGQGGFQQSGAIERLRAMGMDKGRAGMAAIQEQKRVAMDVRDRAYGDADLQRRKAESDITGAEGEWAQNQADYLRDLDTIQGDAETLVEGYMDELLHIRQVDRDVETAATTGEGTWSGNLWASTDKRGEYKDIQSKVEAARGAIDAWKPTTGSMGE